MAILSSTKKTDRRVRRTRSLLLDAFFSLLESKSYKDITVKELCDVADINRGTFYLHFKDIYDMVEQIEQEIFPFWHKSSSFFGIGCWNCMPLRSPQKTSPNLNISTAMWQPDVSALWRAGFYLISRNPFRKSQA